MENPKAKRFVSDANRMEIRSLSCLVDNCDCCAGTDPHHVKSRGSGGGDEIGNYMPLCRVHHTEVETIGGKTFIRKYNLYFDENEEKWKSKF